MIFEKFKQFLTSVGLNKTTQKNYLADLKHFLNWVKNTNYQSFRFDCQTIDAYKKSLIKGKVPANTINRRLSGLCRFGDFLVSQEGTRENPVRDVARLSLDHKDSWQLILKQFQWALKDQGRSQTTIKNYLSDVGQYLKWVA